LGFLRDKPFELKGKRYALVVLNRKLKKKGRMMEDLAFLTSIFAPKHYLANVVGSKQWLTIVGVFLVFSWCLKIKNVSEKSCFQ